MVRLISRLNLNWRLIFWLLFYGLILVILLKNSFGYLDPDLGWHLHLGKEILATRQLPQIEHHNYLLAGKEWADHEWLINLFSYWLYEKVGYFGLNLFFAAMVLATLLILAKLSDNFFSSSQPLFLGVFQIFGLLALLPSLGVRMQEITLLNLAIIIVLLFSFKKKQNYLVLLILPPLFYLWACLHAGFLIGLLLLFSWAGFQALELFLKKYQQKFYFIDLNQTISLKSLLNFLFFSFLSFSATLVTPYGFKLYYFLTSYFNNFYLTNIVEWLPFYYLPVSPIRFFYYVIFILTILLWLIFALAKKNKESQLGQNYQINLWLVFISCLFFYLSIKSRRHFALFFVASLPLMVDFFSSYFKIEKNFLKSKLGKLSPVVTFYLIISLVLVSLNYLFQIKLTKEPFSNYCSIYPCQATNFLKNKFGDQNLRLFNSYNWGGYLIWVWPEKTLFIDGRLPQYPLAGQSLLAEYKEFFKKDRGLAKLNQYQIELVLLDKTKKYQLNWLEKYLFLYHQAEIDQQKNYLVQNLEKTQQWQKVYQDEISLVYLKNSLPKD